MYSTKFIDTFIDHSEGKPLPHPDLEAARGYAKELTNRKRGEVQILDTMGRVVEIWENGSSKDGGLVINVGSSVTQ